MFTFCNETGGLFRREIQFRDWLIWHRWKTHWPHASRATGPQPCFRPQGGTCSYSKAQVGRGQPSPELPRASQSVPALFRASRGRTDRQRSPEPFGATKSQSELAVGGQAWTGAVWTGMGSAGGGWPAPVRIGSGLVSPAAGKTKAAAGWPQVATAQPRPGLICGRALAAALHGRLWPVAVGVGNICDLFGNAMEIC